MTARWLVCLLTALLVFGCTDPVQSDAPTDTPVDEATDEPTDEPLRDDVFFDDFDGDAVDSSVWQVATWQEHGGQTSAERVYVENGHLHLDFLYDLDAGYLSSAIQTREEFLYGRWEARLKPAPVAGILNSFYTIDWNDTSNDDSDSNGSKQEIDIEFLTKSFAAGSGEGHLALHEAGKSSFETNPDIELGFNPSDDFHVYGFEITPEHIEWFVDDRSLHTYAFAAPGASITVDAPYQLKLNSWTREEWVGGPPESGVVATYVIDWIRFTPLDGQ